MGKNMTSGARRLSGNAVTLLITALLCGGSAALIYSGAASRQISNMLISMACYIVMAVSLNLVVGLLGELSLGHAGFMSVGLFTGCLLSIQLAQSVPIGVRMPLSMLLGGVAAAVVGLLVGLPALRLKGDYLAIVTLACGEIIKTIINNLSVTGGAKGLDTSEIYADTRTLLPFAIVLIFLVVLVMMNLKNSRHGRAIMAIRDNRIAAESVGIDVTRYKLMVFMLAAFFAGAAGVLYGHFFANVKAATFDYNMSIEILVIVVLGGMGSIPGSIIAAIVLTALPEAMREFADYRMLLYAIVLIIVMLATNNPTMKEFFHRISPAEVLRRAKKKKEKYTECTKTAGLRLERLFWLVKIQGNGYNKSDIRKRWGRAWLRSSRSRRRSGSRPVRSALFWAARRQSGRSALPRRKKFLRRRHGLATSPIWLPGVCGAAAVPMSWWWPCSGHRISGPA